MEKKNQGVCLCSILFGFTYLIDNFGYLELYIKKFISNGLLFDKFGFFHIETGIDFIGRIQLVLILPIIIFLFVVTEKTYRIYTGVLVAFNITYIANHINFGLQTLEESSWVAEHFLILLDIIFIMVSCISIILYACKKISFTSVVVVTLLSMVPSVILLIMESVTNYAGFGRLGNLLGNLFEAYQDCWWYFGGTCIFNSILRVGLTAGSLFLFKPEGTTITERAAGFNPNFTDMAPATERPYETSPERPATPSSFFTYRGVGTCIFLGIITCGLYWIYWTAVIIKQIKEFHGDYSSATGEVLLYLFIPFYNWYWAYTRGKQLYNDSWKLYGNMPDRSGTYLLLSILGLHWIVFAIIQSNMNHFAVRPPEMSHEL